MKKIEKPTKKVKQQALDLQFLKTHTWSLDAWNTVFKTKDNEKFAKRVIWGAFIGNELIVSLRYNSKGRFVDEDNEPFVVSGSLSIGFVNEEDLSRRDVDAWAEQLANKGIEPIFNQLSGHSLQHLL